MREELGRLLSYCNPGAFGRRRGVPTGEAQKCASAEKNQAT